MVKRSSNKYSYWKIRQKFQTQHPPVKIGEMLDAFNKHIGDTNRALLKKLLNRPTQELNMAFAHVYGTRYKKGCQRCWKYIEEQRAELERYAQGR